MSRIELIYKYVPVWSAGPPEDKAERKLEAYRTVADGWRFGSGKAPSELAINIARRLNVFALGVAGWPSTDVFLGRDGTITLALYHGETDLAFEVCAEGAINLSSETDPEVSEDRLSVQDAAAQMIQRLHWKKWNLSSCCTSKSLTQTLAGSEVLRSRTPVIKAESLLSTMTAPARDREAFVSTREHSTPQFLQSPQFFGDSIPLAYWEVEQAPHLMWSTTPAEEMIAITT